MAKISDKGIIIYISKYNEKCYKVIIFSKNNGIIQTFLKKDKKNTYLIYDEIEFECDNVGQFNYRNLELRHIKSYWEYIYKNKFFLSMMNLSSFILFNLLLEKGVCCKIYDDFYKILTELDYKGNLDIILLKCINFLKEIVIFFGFNLDTKVCSVSNVNETYYISPKTGNCVSKKVGDKYSNKLFIIPKCFLNNYYDINDFKNGINILLYFFEKIFIENEKKEKIKYIKMYFSDIEKLSKDYNI